MFRLVFILLVFIHGLIHAMGFVKAFGFAQINQISKEVNKQMGVLWLIACIIFLMTVIGFIFKMSNWWLMALISVALSQFLIILYWHDARFGTIANVVILIIAGIAAAESRFENQYIKDVKENFAQTSNDSVITIASIAHLPEPVQRYLIYSGAVDKPIVKNFKLKFEGQIRQDEKSPWMPFTSEQFNFIDSPTRLFFMKATMKGLPVWGYHAYKNGIATMDIRLMSLFPVQYQQGDEMNISETVTWFNDVCLYAPGALVDKRIKWEALNGVSAEATFTFQGITISAILHFNEKGELINFISNDRYRIVSKEDTQRIPFSTPAKDFRNINNHIVPIYGEAVWHLPDHDLTYGQFTCVDIAFNVRNH